MICRSMGEKAARESARESGRTDGKTQRFCNAATGESKVKKEGEGGHGGTRSDALGPPLISNESRQERDFSKPSLVRFVCGPQRQEEDDPGAKGEDPQ